MKNILVPIDLSEFSNQVLQEAVQFAKAVNGKLFLLHVVSLDIGFVVGDVGFQYLPELEKTTLENDARELNEMQEKVRSQGVDCEGLVKQGIPVDLILEQTESLGAEYVVIGSQGHGTLYEALVGSVCHDVIKKSRVPLLVVPNLERKK